MSIAEALDAVQREERVGLILAVESGSRAWGFPSPDSDWDVRFLYARPTAWHLSLQPGRDVIERSLPGDIDLAGWDARKALNLLLAGNTALREWLRSPIRYHATPLAEEFAALAARLPVRAAAAHHYRRLAERVVSRYLRDPEQVNLKKYLYAVRPALALRWLRENPAGEPPMDLPALLAGVTIDAALRDDLSALLARKALTAELGLGARLPRLDALMADEIAAASDLPRHDSAAEHSAAEALLRRCTAWADEVTA